MQKIIKQRIKWMTSLLFLIFPCIIVRLFYLQIIAHPYYSQEANRNLDQYRDITPRRGAIYDSKGYLLVKTSAAYNVTVCPAKVTTTALRNLSELLPKPQQEIEEKVEKCKELCQKEVTRSLSQYHNLPPKKYTKMERRFKQDYEYRRYPLYRDIPRETALKLFQQGSAWQIIDLSQTHIYNGLEGIDIEYQATRQYPWNSLLTHILGYVGLPQDTSRERDYRPGDIVGKSGIELLCEDKLRGRRGCYVGSREGFRFTESPMDGMDIFLTIDAKVQNVAEQALDRMIEKTPDATGGAAVVIDVTNGDIVVMASSPRYDNDTLRQKYSELSKDPLRPLQNRAISNYYPPPPGSVFKVMIALYALEHQIITVDTQFQCRGYLHQRGQFRCTHVHGWVNLIEALEGSCNIYFYHVGELLGAERLYECARIFGYGEKTGLGFPDEIRGDVPNPSASWTAGDSRMLAIGQRMTSTPLQVALSLAMVANRGVMPGVRIIKEYRPPRVFNATPINPDNLPEEAALVADTDPNIPAIPKIKREWPIQQQNWLSVREGMRRVVEGQRGTAREILALLGGLKIAAKTGTSQVANGPDHAWFAGFAPLDNPRYAFAVFVEHGGYGGTTAAPVAAQILRELF